MNLRDKCRLVLNLFSEVDKEISIFKKSNNIDCINHCMGVCCNKEDIYATTLEFLPLAFHLHNENKSEDFITALNNSQNKVCILYSKETGKCKYYEYRGLICRLFGFASFRIKDMSPQIVTCQYIKNIYKREIASQLNPIIIADYQRRLSLIDTIKGTKFLHINESIKSAIEMTGLFNDYIDKELTIIKN